MCILFLHKDISVKKAKITAEGDFVTAFIKAPFIRRSILSFIIINLMWGERQDFAIHKPAKGWKTVSWQNGHVLNHCIPETIKFDFRILLLRRIKYL